jgi:hypothetical protein
MTGIKDYNYPFFCAVAKELRGLGYEINNPAELGLPSDAEYETCLRAALNLLLESSTAILSLPGWKRSTGACVEHLNAYFVGMPRYVYLGAGKIVKEEHHESDWNALRLKMRFAATASRETM